MIDAVSTGLVRRPSGSAQSLLGLVAFAALVTLAAAGGGLAAASAGATYAALELPPWAPPSWLFGPVWTVLYAMVAVSGWLVWRRYGVGRAIALWVLQLVLNALWTPIFFAAGEYAAALVDIVVLDVVVIATLAVFARRVPAAAWLLAPYVAWTLFATALNAAILVLD